MVILEDNIEKYLENSYYINWKDEEIKKLADKLKSDDEIETVSNIFHFVRDKIKHSYDAQDHRVTIRATDVLREGVGICWAKSNLFAALLRACNIPSGICYQRLTLGYTPDTGYCIHALNAIFLSELDKWIRLDARGNIEGVCAEMSIDEEKLAFKVRPEYGEIDYKGVYAEPLEFTMEVLENSSDVLETYLYNLPENSR